MNLNGSGAESLPHHWLRFRGHGADRAMHVPLAPNLGLGRRRVQVCVHDVQEESPPAFDTDDCHGGARLLLDSRLLVQNHRSAASCS